MKFIRNIKSISAGILSLFLTTIFFACKDDSSLNQPELVIPAKTYYLTLSIMTPKEGATRDGNEDNTWPGPETNTDGSSSQGEVNATEPESTINSVELYVCHEKRVLAYFYTPVGAELLSPSAAGYSDSKANYVVRAEINEQQIEDFAIYAADGLDLYVIANTSSTNKFTDTSKPQLTIDEDAKYTISVIGTFPIEDFGDNGKFLPLTNAEKYSFKLEGVNETADIEVKIQALLEKFTSTVPGVSILNMEEPLKLERGVARIEYKDIERNNSSGETQSMGEVQDNADLPDNTFAISGLDVKLQLATLQVFNVNKESYYFRHGSTGSVSSASDKPTIFEVERGSRDGYTWIATPDWSDWNATNSFTKGIDFFNPLDLSTSYLVSNGSNAKSDAGIINVNTLLTRKTSDNDGYHPWCYVTENTMPSISFFIDYAEEEGESDPDIINDDEETQTPMVTKYATGVAFRFLVLGTDGNPLVYEPSETAQTSEEGSDDSTVSAKKSLYPKEIKNSFDMEDEDEEAIIITDNEGKWVKVFPEVYEDGDETKTGYFLTYIAPIVHNNQQGYDPSNGNFPPMFYGVVRNNTYQMSINSITGLPRPNDPRSLFISLDIKILAWTVRETEYEF